MHNTSRALIAACTVAMLAGHALPARAQTGANAGTTNQDWWPERLDLTPLRLHGADSSPMDRQFDYRKAFASLDLNAVKQDIRAALTTSQPWWPADYGHYGPFFIRMAWHAAGTYRVGDGRGGAGGGQQRFEPENSWPDNANLDKARRLLWPIKQKYGQKISWADLMVLTGNVALESMGFRPFGFAAGRTDQWQADVVYWGTEKTWLADERHSGDRQLQNPLAAVQMGLIYVNPEGPGGRPDPLAAARDIRQAFGRMAMNDEETVALIAGGHTFGKAHGAHSPGGCIGAEPAAAAVEAQGIGWSNRCGTGHAGDTVTSGLEGAWTSRPTAWTNEFFVNLFRFEWVQTKSPGGATQWVPADHAAATLVPDAHDASKRHAPIMLTTDLALRFDPQYQVISKRFHDDPEAFRLAFAKAWFKLTHRDLGPRARYLGPEVPNSELIWQDPLPAASTALVNAADIATLKTRILASGLTVPELVRTAWASAATFRGTDMRGGANGARLRLAPQKDWAANDPADLARTLQGLERIQQAFNRQSRRPISFADLVVLGGVAAVEQAARQGGVTVTVPFTPGRVDATDAHTDAASFAFLEPTADGFRNYYRTGQRLSPAEALVDKANTLTLSVPEMTVLVGGLRALNANTGQAAHGVFTERPGTLSNDFFVHLLDMRTAWSKAGTDGLYEGKDRTTGRVKWTATPVDLIFGSNSELRAVSEFYASDDAKTQFVRDFVAAWHKVMMLDRF